MRAIETADLFKYRFLAELKAAPAAERLAFTVSACDRAENGYTSSIWLYEDGRTRRLTGMDKERSFIWEDDTHLLFPAVRSEADKKRRSDGEVFTAFYRLDIFGGEAEKAFELPLDCGELKPLCGDLWYFTSAVDARCPDLYALSKKQKAAFAKAREADADYHVFTRNPWWFNGRGFLEEQVRALFVLDRRTGALKRLGEASHAVGSAEAVGGKLYYSASRCKTTPDRRAELYCYDPATDKTVCLENSERFFGIHCIGAYRGKLLCLTELADAPYGLNTNDTLHTFDPSDGTFTLLSAPDLSAGSTVGTDVRYGGGAFCKVYRDTLYMIHTVRNSAVLQKLLPDGTFEPVCAAEGSLDCFDITASGGIYGIALYDMRPGELYRLSGRPKRLTQLNRRALTGRYLAKPEKLTIRSADTDIDGWVLLPKDYDPNKTYPAVLDIHGGPKTVYGEVFYHEMQVWASKGWFVFFCNPIGGDGRGNAFMDIRGKYGTVDYQNIMDFTDAVLAKYPQIDPQRVGVTGGSYGGFMTNWIVGHTDRFACAATQRSISNWISFYGVSDIGIRFTANEQAATLFDDPEKLWEHSPLKYAGNVTTPTLFIHSDEDYRCPISEGLQFYTALVDRGVEARFVWFKGENHELSRGGKPLHRLRRLNEITDWMQAHLEK